MSYLFTPPAVVSVPVVGKTEEFPFHVFYQVEVTKGGMNPVWISCETIPVPTGLAGEIGASRLLDFGQNVDAGFVEYVEVDQ